jgi:hypothetical protein
VLTYPITDEEDIVKWGEGCVCGNNGKFTVKAMYDQLTVNDSGKSFTRIRKAKIPYKIKIFLRLFEIEAVLTKDNMINALFAWLISHQPAVLFSHNKPAISNQPAVLFSQNKPAPAISHQPTEQAVRESGLVIPHASSVRGLQIVHTCCLDALQPNVCGP